MTTSELIEILAKLPPATRIKASYDTGCAWGWVKEAHVFNVEGDLEVELEVD